MRLRTKIRLWWHKLWVKPDESQTPLDFDVMMVMTPQEREEYQDEIEKRRRMETTHQRDR